MEKKRNVKFKKIIAILCIFVVLESYFSYFAQIAIATNEALLGTENDSETLLNDEQNPDDLPFEQNDSSVDPLLGGKEESNEEEPTENEVITTGEENLEGETEELPEETAIDDELADEENQNEEPIEELVEELPEESIEESSDEVEEEPYVEPEVSVEVTSENASIYKGFLYANATSELRYATNYNTIDVVTIVGGKNIKSLTVQDEPDKIQLITSQKIALKDDMHYRKTRVSVDEFNNILGEDGYITVYTPEGEIIGFINKDCPIVNNEYIFEYPMYLTSVKFEMQSIQADGTISIKNDKSIKETSDFSRNQISLFATINTITQVGLYVGEELRSSSAEGNINLEETESRMTLDVDTDTLSVEDKNDVTINVTLKTDEERYDLFENPIVDLEFPSAVEEVEVTGITLLYKNGLSIDNWNITTNSMGRKVLRINLAGSQLEYTPGAVQEGTTIVAYTELDVNRLTADTSENLRMTYSNKDTVRKTYSLEGRDSEDISFSFVGRQELVRAMEIKTSDENVATSYDEETEKIQIETNKEQIVTITSSIVNNYEATLDDVVIIGRIPFVGNKDGNGNDLGTNFDTKLQNAISTTGVIADVYYSEDGLAEANSDSWREDLDNLENYKSYKIVIREKTLAKGERLSFEYHLVVPEDVGYNAKGCSCYEVFYKIDTQSYSSACFTGMYTETKEIEMEDIDEEARQKLAELTVGTQVSQCGIILGELDKVYERQILKYTVVVRNTSNVTAKNVVLRCNAENANLYDWDYVENESGMDETTRHVRYLREFTQEEKEYSEFEIGDLEPGDSKTVEYQVIVRDLSEIENPEVYGKINIKYDDTIEKNVETIKNSIEEALLEVRVGYANTETLEDIDTSTEKQFKAYIETKNITETELRDVDLVLVLPKLLEFDKNSYYYGTSELTPKIEKSEESEFVTFKIPSIKSKDTQRFYLVTKTSNIDLEKASEQIEIYGYAQTDNNKYYSNKYTKTLHQGKTKLEYVFTSDISTDVVLQHEDELTYILDLNNVGKIRTGYFSITDNLPNGLEIVEVKLLKGEEEEIIEPSNYNKVVINMQMLVGESVKLVIKTRVNERDFSRDQEFIENQIKINGGFLDGFETQVIAHRIKNYNVTSEAPNELSEYENNEEYEIEYDDPNHSHSHNHNTDNHNNPATENTGVQEGNEYSNEPQPSGVIAYYISGVAWIDGNQDGARQANEKMKEGVVATLYKANSNGGLDTSRVIGETATDSDGRYTFKNVENGNYIVVFDYNSSKYKLTKYQVSTAKSTENSDAISKAVTINGELQILGITDVLTVNQSSLMSVDIGLVDKASFDLSLTKVVSSVTVKNDKGTQVYNYENSDNARLEIRSKYYKSSVLDIEYKFIVQNEGDVSGYVNKVVDYLPDNVQVVLNSSPGWYIGSDNGLYYTGLLNKEIGPGEEEEFTLVLRKNLEDGEAVKLENGAEIVEATNNLGLVDKDSLESNKMEKEDDYGIAILTVSVSTGNTIQYIAVILIIIIMISVTIMMIIKFKNTKKIYR